MRAAFTTAARLFCRDETQEGGRNSDLCSGARGLLRAPGQRETLDGIVVTRVRLPAPAATPEELLEAMQKAITPRTRLILVFHLYLTRQILPVRSTADYARPRAIKLLIDGALGLGNMKVDILQLESDFYAASSHNYAGGPRGTGIFYARPEHIPSISPLCSHFTVARCGDAGAKEFTPAFDDFSVREYEHLRTHSPAMEPSLG